MAGRPTIGPPTGPPLQSAATDPATTVSAEPNPALRRIRSVLPTALLIEIGLLVITGIALWFLYEPTLSQAFPELNLGSDLSSSQRVSQVLRWSHRLIGSLAILTSAATALALCFGPEPPLRRVRGRLAAAALVAATIGAMITGYELPWDQLALRAVTVGSDLSGFGVFFDDDVRFAFIGGREVESSTLIRWLVVHAALLGPLALGLATLVWRRRSVSEPVEASGSVSGR